MKFKSPYHTRPTRFLQIIDHREWKIKLYSISIKNERISQINIDEALGYLDEWLSKSKLYDLENYKIATLILHEAKEGCYAIINWWIDENMLQQFVYLKTGKEFELYSDRGIITCVWEMAVLWHERNAWIQHVLKKNENPDIGSYLNDHLNEDI